MSSSLYWTPPPKDQKKNDIGSLKYPIGKYYDEDYNGGNYEQTAGKELIPVLKGIILSGNAEMRKDAEALIAAIEKYGEVQLIISW